MHWGLIPATAKASIYLVVLLKFFGQNLHCKPNDEKMGEPLMKMTSTGTKEQQRRWFFSLEKTVKTVDWAIRSNCYF